MYREHSESNVSYLFTRKLQKMQGAQYHDWKDQGYPTCISPQHLVGEHNRIEDIFIRYYSVMSLRISLPTVKQEANDNNLLHF